MNDFLITLRILFFGLSICSCTQQPTHVDIQYLRQTQSSASKIEAIKEVRLHVVDSRQAATPSTIFDGPSNSGARRAYVEAQRPVLEIVQSALTRELIERGFHIGSAGSLMAVDVIRFESIHQEQGFTVGALATIDLSVQVRRPNDSIAYARTFTIRDDEESAFVGTLDRFKRSMERSLSKIIGKMMDDPALITSLQ